MLTRLFGKIDRDTATGLTYEYDVKTNDLRLYFVDLDGGYVDFKIKGGKTDEHGLSDELDDFLKFLNQLVNGITCNNLRLMSNEKVFHEVGVVTVYIFMLLSQLHEVVLSKYINECIGN